MMVNRIKALRMFAIVCIITTLLSSCFGGADSPDLVVGYMFKNFKDSNIVKAQEYVSDPSQLEIKTEDEKRKFTLISKNLEYEVKEIVEEEGNKAVVKVKVANFNLNKILDEAIVLAIQKVKEENPNDNNISDEKTKKALDDALVEVSNTYKGSMVGGDINVNLIKEDGKWLVEFSDEIQNYILGDK